MTQTTGFGKWVEGELNLLAKDLEWGSGEKSCSRRWMNDWDPSGHYSSTLLNIVLSIKSNGNYMFRFRERLALVNVFELQLSPRKTELCDEFLIFVFEGRDSIYAKIIQ